MHIFLVILRIFMRMQRISVSIPLLFGVYLVAFNELPILIFKPKMFPYFAGSTRKRRQIVFTKFLAGSHFTFTTCTVYTSLKVFYIGDTANSRPQYMLSMVSIVSPSTILYVYVKRTLPTEFTCDQPW